MTALLCGIPLVGCATPPPHAQAEPAPTAPSAPAAPASHPPPTRAELEQALDAAAPLKPGPESLGPLEQIATDQRAPTARRTRAVEAIACIEGVQTAAILAGWAKDPHADLTLRVAAAVALGRRGGSSAVADLTPLLADSHPQLRAAAARALGNIGGDSARESLEDRLAQEEDPPTREAIQQSLTAMQP